MCRSPIALGFVGLWICVVAISAPRTLRASEPEPLVFTSNRDGLPKLYLTDPASGATRLLHQTEGSESLPAWSPDGTKITFASSRSGNHDIWIMDADGGNVKQLTTDPAPDYVTTWSPDGKKIAFTTQRAGNPEIFVMNADGTEQINLTNNPASDGDPAWSPDGKTILFASDRGGDGHRLYLMNSDGSSVRPFPVKKGGNVPVFPAWSPDGKQVAYADEDGPAGEIFIANADGTQARKLTSLGGINTFPAWSPDSRQIALVHYTDRDATGSLWTVTVSDGVQTQLGPAGSYLSGRPAWRPKR